MPAIKTQSVFPNCGISESTTVCTVNNSDVPTEKTNNKRKRCIEDTQYMGMVWVIAEAEKKGFDSSDPGWCNFGKGAPESEQISGGPKRLKTVELIDEDHNYGPVNGTLEFRQAIADHYNRLYRVGKKKYTAENVGVAQGGRMMLSRLFRVLRGRVGYQTPDYAGYQDQFDNANPNLEPVHIPTEEEDNFALPAESFANVAENLEAFVCSNPNNPTGNVIKGEDLASYCETARSTDCTLIMDEFYSHFIYEDEKAGSAGISAVEHVDDPATDPVVVIDGMTKSFRYPGWRLAWILGPPEIVNAVGCVASSMDGGPSNVSQRMALPALRSGYMYEETTALRETFVLKRNMMLPRLRAMGFRCLPCDSTFYIWACCENLPSPLNNGISLFSSALDRKIIIGPGNFFDINPKRKRKGPNKFAQWVRFSFGPSYQSIDKGLTRLEQLCRDHGVKC